MQSLFKNTSPTTNYKIEIESVRLVLGIPRISAFGRSQLSKKNQPPMFYPGNFYEHHTFYTGTKQGQVTIKFNRKRLPNYILITFHSEKFFKNDYTTEASKDDFSLPLQANVDKAIIRFDGDELYQHDCNLNLKSENGRILRQELLKHGNYFDVAKMDESYFASDENQSQIYSYPHIGLSFDSNPDAHEVLVPVGDHTSQRRDLEKPLEIVLFSKGEKKLPDNALVLVTTIDTDKGHTYCMKEGDFI